MTDVPHRAAPTITAVPRLALIPPGAFERVATASAVDPDARLALLADMCRFNALNAVKRAGSGHLGSTFSSLDLVAHLLWEELNVLVAFATTKGPAGIVAVLSALYPVTTIVLARVLLAERLDRSRRIGGGLALGGAAAVAVG